MRKLNSLALAVIVVLSLMSSAMAQDDDMMMSGPDVIVTLEPTPFTEGAGLSDVGGWAHVVSDDGHIHIVLDHMGVALPEGSVLEGWVVDAGLDGGPGETNASDADEAYGVAFGDEAFDASVEAAPYALSTGVLADNGEGAWELVFDIPDYNFSPYDAVVITLESDGNTLDGFDPRPGTPVFAGAIADGAPADEMMMDDDMNDDMSDDDSMDDDMMMGEAVEVILAPTPFAEASMVGAAGGTAQVTIEDGSITITVELNGGEVLEGMVLEGWLVDAGIDGGPGMTHASDADEAFGVAFGDETFDALVESAPYALSTGVLHVDMDMMGTYSVTFHIPNYNFSAYNAVVITIETDGNTTDGFDPRPGTPVLAGEIDTMM